MNGFSEKCIKTHERKKHKPHLQPAKTEKGYVIFGLNFSGLLSNDRLKENQNKPLPFSRKTLTKYGRRMKV